MGRIKIALNLRKPGNYAFFCPVSRLHLTRSNPVGSADGVTSAILMGLRSKVLLDVDGVVDLKTGTITGNKEEVIKTEQPTNASEAPKTEVKEEVKEVKAEEKKEDSETSNEAKETVEAPKRKGRKTTNK